MSYNFSCFLLLYFGSSQFISRQLHRKLCVHFWRRLLLGEFTSVFMDVPLPFLFVFSSLQIPLQNPSFCFIAQKSHFDHKMKFSVKTTSNTKWKHLSPAIELHLKQRNSFFLWRSVKVMRWRFKGRLQKLNSI